MRASPERRRRTLLLGVAATLVAGLAGWTWLSRDGSGTSTGPAACSSGQLRSLDLSRQDQGRLAWSDDFDGPTVDRDRWTVRDDTSLSFDQARIERSAVSVKDGRLRITARSGGTPERPVVTGYLDTIGHHEQRYGRWEMRARLPVDAGRSRALWPAFWLRETDGPAEIDVMEAWGTPVTDGRSLPGSAAWAVHSDTESGPGSQSLRGWSAPDLQLDRGLHDFAVDRVPGCLRFSVDGRTTGVVQTRDAPWLASTGALNIRLNLQVGGAYWGRLDPSRPGTTRLPATFEVDRIRVYLPR
ncbi:hypothetical protein ASD11_12880 [Aeromicrobium sp. Root495]|uniref:glycoside hydrolase family 16 protein n=1 Tax=Aeromicrobium sp. Root495 TaxID=1736550 RepID=UPI0006F95B6B|nr:glycoside hydrolase family 16 protein [Aeromicrobium sp. Root495]KQY60341.1 hypothetical protein ASD11_12880 [Aeromicrobium sp. Root495]